MTAIDNDFVVFIDYAAANLDDGEAISDCHIKQEQVLHVDGDSTSLSYSLFYLSLTILQLLLLNRQMMKRLLDLRAGVAELTAAPFHSLTVPSQLGAHLSTLTREI
jgi:hypothetical protein